ncbi:hypothetical protein ABK040_002196 [Willaertia magna]
MKKLWILGSQTIKTKLGKAETTEDEEFNLLKSKFKAAHKASENFVKHVNQLIENFHAFSTTLAFLSEDFRDVNTQGSTKMEQAGQMLEKVSKNIESDCVLPFQTNVTSSVVSSVNEYIVLFEPLEKLFKERKNVTLQLDYYRQQVEKLSEKQSKNPLELPKAKEKMNTFKEQWENINNQCKQMMLDILEKEKDVFEPAIEQVCANILDYNSKLNSTIVELKGYSAPIVIGTPLSSHSSNNNATTSTAREMVFDCEWYYIDDKVETQGPVTFKQLQSKFKSGEVSRNTHVYGGELTNWIEIHNVGGLEDALKK